VDVCKEKLLVHGGQSFINANERSNVKNTKKRKQSAESKQGFSEIGLKIRQEMIKAGTLIPQRKAA